MKKELLPQTKIGDFSIGVEMDQDEIGLYVASADVSVSCAFKFDEWKKFVQGINKADAEFKRAMLD
ncbi:MAG TPA: hypothetical protein ENH85_13940 [Candidatus Scalindua sp.]|nr:hypothetical protein [Candidatus Scalindua sp.]